MTADILAAEADFFSIGTNDLTQYGLAMDRGNPNLAAAFDALHPAVLRLIAATMEGANRYNRPTGVCGGLASDVEAAPLLVGLGVRSLSAATSQIADLKAAHRQGDDRAMPATGAEGAGSGLGRRSTRPYSKPWEKT